MSEVITPESPVGDPTDATTEAPEAEATHQAEEAPKGNREARYRVERNQAREALVAAQARIDGLLSREVERIASKNLSHPADIFTLSGKTVADVLDENGDVNPDLVEQLASEILGSRPGLRPNARAVDHTQGWGSRGAPQPSFSDLFGS
ncbi:hypothetical protein [Mycobacterium intracellulare]|uniref:hypothetical protein n=1 Tax=Mycobacterium intracellulare TaxID=1767 RepID=UPI0012FDB3E5|nr:hypothetical protein [Mycobacterium intracellulare]